MDTDINKLMEFTKKSNSELTSNQESINSLLVASLQSDIDKKIAS